MTPNTTQIPNNLFNGEMAKMKDTELRITLLVARKTLGWIEDLETGMRKKEDWIARYQLIKFTGKTGRAISTAIANCIKNGWIEVRDKEGKILNTPQKRTGKKIYYRLGKIFLERAKRGEKSSQVEETCEKIAGEKSSPYKRNYITKDSDSNESPSSILIKKKNQETTELFDYYKQEFKKMTGKTPIFNWGKCVKLAKPHLETLGLKTMKHLVYCYLYETKGEDRKFFKENVWGLSCFLSANTINKINLKYYESN